MSWKSQPSTGLSFNLRLFRLFRLSWLHTSAWSLSRPPTQSWASGFGNKAMPNRLPSLPNKCSPSLPRVYPWNGCSVREVFWWGFIMCASVLFCISKGDSFVICVSLDLTLVLIFFNIYILEIDSDSNPGNSRLNSWSRDYKTFV